MLPRRTVEYTQLWSEEDDARETVEPGASAMFPIAIDESPPRSPTPHLRTAATHVARPSYVPRTLQGNEQRYSILPAFPTSLHNHQPAPLLSSVPRHKLSHEQLSARRKNDYPLPYTVNMNNFDMPSYFSSSYRSFISSLLAQFNVHEAIIEYNLYRFDECFRAFGEECLRRHRYHAEQFDLTTKQKKYAFEFYLQMDVGLFFMKTCSFRGAHPRSNEEGLFCIEEPSARYGLSPCNNCPVCVPPYDMSRRQQPTVCFGPSQKHRFHNGYQVILNCPANCHTQNMIYVMTCPCNEFEYIGETSQRLGDRLWYHRQHCNRIIHEFLLGEKNVRLSGDEQDKDKDKNKDKDENKDKDKDFETLVKDRMLLYRHAARCPSTMQIFLNFNPIYGCFMPIPLMEATRQNRSYAMPPTLVLLDSENPTAIGSKDRRAVPDSTQTRGDEGVRSRMRYLPPVPHGYTFSTRQRVQQFQYFKNRLDLKPEQDPSVDIFNSAVLAILPNDVSIVVRRFVEALFITHTEAKLNTFGHLLPRQDDGDRRNDLPADRTLPEVQVADRGEWCRNIVFPYY